MFRPKELHCSLDSQSLHCVNVGTAAIVPDSRITLGILIGQGRALRFQDGTARIVLRSYQVNGALLSVRFLLEYAANISIRRIRNGSPLLPPTGEKPIKSLTAGFDAGVGGDDTTVLIKPQPSATL